MSRAKALCVVIGHPVALEADVYGRQLLAKCLRSGTYRGPTLTKKIQRDAGVLPLDVNESMLEKSELVGNYVDHLTELSLAYRGEEDEEEDDVILLQPSDFHAFYAGDQAMQNFLS